MGSTPRKAIWLWRGNKCAIRVSILREGTLGSCPTTAAYDVTVSGLVLNFIPDLNAGVAEMVRVTKLGGTVAAYVWDYAGKMELMRYFWDAVVALKPEARERDEGRRFPICQPDPLRNLFVKAGLHEVEV